MKIYVTGTDTGAGKSFASVALLHALRRDGATAVGMKPVASGAVVTPDGLRNDDALALQAASDPHPDYAQVNPFALPEPTAPQIAAALAGVAVEPPGRHDAAYLALLRNALGARCLGVLPHALDGLPTPVHAACLTLD